MNPANWWRVIILITVSAVTIVTFFTFWFLELFPQYMLQLALAPLIFLFLFAILASRQKYRDRFRELLTEYRSKVQGRSGLLFRYGQISNAVMLVILIALFLISAQNPEIPYMPYLVFASFIGLLISFVILISGLLKLAGKWGLLLIAIGITMAILRFLTQLR